MNSSIFSCILNLDAQLISDKFHIIRSLMEACQDVRVRLRQDLLREKRLKYQEHKKLEKERKKDCQTYGKEYVKRNLNTWKKNCPTAAPQNNISPLSFFGACMKKNSNFAFAKSSKNGLCRKS